MQPMTFDIPDREMRRRPTQKRLMLVNRRSEPEGGSCRNMGVGCCARRAYIPQLGMVFDAMDPKQKAVLKPSERLISSARK